jgi:hypothetical protein
MRAFVCLCDDRARGEEKPMNVSTLRRDVTGVTFQMSSGEVTLQMGPVAGNSLGEEKTHPRGSSGGGEPYPVPSGVMRVSLDLCRAGIARVPIGPQ